ncbi:MAG: bacterial Ig-like domain-containing protein [Eubacteriales bacterium]
MAKKFKFFILLICVCSLISICVMPSFADQTGEISTELSQVTDETSVPAELTEPETSEITGTGTEPEATDPETSEVTGTEPDVTDPPVLTPVAIEIKTPGKTEYFEGELFDTGGFILKIKYENGEREAPLSEATSAHYGELTLGMTSISFSIEGFTFEVPITVVPAPKVIDKIELTATKTDYLALDLIDQSTLTVTLIYTDGTSEPLELDACSFYPALETPLSAFTTSLNVSYSVGEGKSLSASLDIQVSPILGIEIEGLDSVSVYQAQPLVKPEGLTVTAYYDDAKTVSKVITEYDISAATELVTPDDNKKFAATLIADTFTENIELNVCVIVSYTVTGIKPVYYYGDAFANGEVRVNAVYEDTTVYDVTAQVEISAPEIIAAGSKIAISHNGFDLAAFLKTELPVGTLNIVMNPNKVQYEIGETFDSTGLIVAIQYSNGTRKVLGDDDYQLIVSDPLTAADNSVAVTYFGASTSLSIKVGDDAYIVSLNIIGAPDVLNYFEGGLINTSGLIIEAYLSDGTRTIVDPRILTFTPALDAPLTTDVTTVVISANDGDADKYCSVSFPIVVTKKIPVALVATSSPVKLDYKEGETFDPDGLKLSLIYNDGSIVELSIFSFSPSLETAFVLRADSAEKVIVYAVYEYEGGQITYPIEVTVQPTAIENIIVSRYPVKTVYEIGEEFDPTGVELLIVYADRTLGYQFVPDGYYTYSPSVITADTREIVFEFRGLRIALPITVNGGTTTSEQTTDPVDTPDTPPSSDNTTDVTTDPDDTTTDDTTNPPPESSSVETPGVSEQTTSPDDPGTGDDTTQGTSGGGTSSLLYLWIVIIAIIIVALVVLIIYYKRNFT